VNIKKLLVGTTMLLGMTSAFADLATVKANLKIQYPSTTITSVEESPIKGIYEVVLGKNITYTDESAKFFLFGDVIRMSDQTNLTSPKRDDLKKLDFASLPLKDAIKYTKGNGSRKIAVFSDPQCPFCKKLEAELLKLDNVTIYIFTNPIVGLHPEARNLSKKIWCSKDKAKAWREYLLSSIEPKSDGLCENPVDRNIGLAQSLGLNGTPMSVLEDGSVIEGSVSFGELDYKLDKVANDLKNKKK
jgi:thiol:disulfide interchange protein DsbC